MGESVLFPGITVLEPSLSLFFIQFAIIIGLCKSLSILGQYFKLPSVVFEIIGGIVLGPSALGKYQPYHDAIIPSSSLETLSIVANFGLQIYLFLVGLELDLTILKSHSRTTGFVAVVGMILPFGFGIALSILLYPHYVGESVNGSRTSFTTFAVFIGTAMAITALPVLARILKECHLSYTKPGFIALGAAVITDAMAWVLLVVAISLANSGSSAIAGWTFLGITSYAAIVFTLGRYLFHALVYRVENYSVSAVAVNNLFVLSLVLLFLSASFVAQLGIDPIVGSFIFGIVVPRNTHVYKACTTILEPFVTTLLLPLYFAVSGLHTDITQLNIYPDVPILLLVCAVSTLGKVIGAGCTSYLCGMNARESAAVAVLMNTRGLVELIVLNIGRSFNVLNDRAFSIMVLMCLFTTFITCPLVYLVYPVSARHSVYGIEQDITIPIEGVVDENMASQSVHSSSSSDHTTDIGAHSAESGIEMPHRNSDSTQGTNVNVDLVDGKYQHDFV